LQSGRTEKLRTEKVYNTLMNNPSPLLEITDLHVTYGGIKAVRGISFRVEEGEILTLIGANGAGKTSVLKAVSGVIPYKGEIRFDGCHLANLAPHRIAALGIAHVPEGRGIFGNLTVAENLQLAAWHRKDTARVRRDVAGMFERFPRLGQRRGQAGGTLSGGEQQMLSLARALLSGARLLLLDEPSMGLSPLLVREVFKLLVEINLEGKTIVLVEQNAAMSLEISPRACVLDTGAITLTGTGRQLIDNPVVKESYLGA
jgi:branched-chain amino acid transport system ATP-binding protein